MTAGSPVGWQTVAGIPSVNKKILIIGGVAGLLAAGGGGGYFVFVAGAKAEKAEMAEEEAPPPPPLPELPKVTFFKLDPLNVPFSNANKSRRLMLVVSLELRDADAKARVEHLLPRLRDAFLQDLYQRPLEAKTGGQTDFDQIKWRLMARSEAVLGANVVTGILVQQAVQMGG